MNLFQQGASRPPLRLYDCFAERKVGSIVKLNVSLCEYIALRLKASKNGGSITLEVEQNSIKICIHGPAKLKRLMSLSFIGLELASESMRMKFQVLFV